MNEFRSIECVTRARKLIRCYIFLSGTITKHSRDFNFTTATSNCRFTIFILDFLLVSVRRPHKFLCNVINTLIVEELNCLVTVLSVKDRNNLVISLRFILNPHRLSSHHDIHARFVTDFCHHWYSNLFKQWIFVTMATS